MQSYFSSLKAKKVFKCFLLLVFNLYILVDWTALAGGVFLIGDFLLLNYVVKLSSLKLAEGNRYLKPRMIWITEFTAWALFILFNPAVVLGLWVL